MSFPVEALGFYEGAVKATSADISLSIGSEAVAGTATYILHNTGNEEENVAITFPGYASASVRHNNIPFNEYLQLIPGQTATLEVSFSSAISSGQYSFQFNPEILFDGLTPIERFDSLSLRVKFTSADMDLAQSSIALSPETKLDSRSYYAEQTKVYPKNIYLRWYPFEQPFVTLSRTFSPLKAGENSLTVTSEISNKGERPLENIELRDSYLASNFAPLQPSEEFNYIAGANEPVYRWKMPVPYLAPGETKTFVYTLSISSFDNLRSLPLRAFLNDVLVSSIDGAPLFVKPEQVFLSDPSLDAGQFRTLPSQTGQLSLEAEPASESDFINLREERNRFKNYKKIFLYIIFGLALSVFIVGAIIYNMFRRRGGYGRN